MTSEMVAQMSQAELKELLEAVVKDSLERKLLEILGDPDEGLESAQAVRERLLRQKQAGSRQGSARPTARVRAPGAMPRRASRDGDE